MKKNFFSDQFEDEELVQLERKQDLRRKRFVRRMERKLWLKQNGYGRSNKQMRESRHRERPYYSKHVASR